MVISVKMQEEMTAACFTWLILMLVLNMKYM